MAMSIAQLEQDWLAAEALADQIKAQTKQLRETGEIEVSMGNVDELAAKRDEAERAASEAFDRLWSAREQQVA